MELRHANKADFAAIRELWSLCFGDEAAYIDDFLNDLFDPCHSYLLEEEGLVRSMIFSIPTILHTTQGPLPSVYLYAMATHPNCQGRGLGLKLMDYVARCCRERSIPVITLKPADAGLFRFYAKAGYQTAFYCGTCTAAGTDAPKGTVTPVSPEEYRALREELLAGRCHVEFDEAFLDHQRRVCAQSGGGLLRLQWEAHTACAVTERVEGQWQVKELLAPQGLERQALALLERGLGEEALTARIPDRSGAPFGVALWTREPLPLDGWLGLALD